MSGVRPLAAPALILAALAGCATAPLAKGGKPLPPLPHLALSVEPAGPASLPPGTIVKVQAQLQGEGQLDWVSGTVRLMGAPVMGLRQAPDGSWGFKTMVPPMSTVPAGHYKVKVWGRLKDGRELSDSLDYEVK